MPIPSENKPLVIIAVTLLAAVFALGGYLLFQMTSGSRPAASKVKTIEKLPVQKTETAAKATIPPVTNQNTIYLSVISPQNADVVSTKIITVKGTTAPDADVSINEKEIKADSQGNFLTTLTLDEGENFILVTANDESGNSSEKEISVVYTP